MKILSGKLAAILLLITLLACGCGAFSAVGEEKCPYEEFLVVDVFDGLANYQGIQSGWFAKLVKDKFNMELNIIAPNVAGGGDTLFEVRCAAGNLGDIVIFSGEKQELQNMVTSGLIMDIEPYLQGKDIMRFETAIRNVNKSITPEGLFAIPTELSSNAPTVPSESKEPTYGPYIRWDLYAELGYPPINTLEDLLPVLKQMQELCPVTETGEKTYAFSFFRDWDANMMNAGKQPCCFYGYDESGFVLVKADSSDYQSIIDSDSLYIRVLKWYFDANQMGLVDPESLTLNFQGLVEKYKKGQILYSPWPWVAQQYYNTISNKKAGKGFMMADISDMQIYSYGCSGDGNYKTIVGVGSQTKDPERMVDFINWLYSPEGIAVNSVNGMADTAGPQGLCWEYGEEGPYLTEFGKMALLEGDTQVPEEWGGGSWKDGISMLNFMPVTKCEIDEQGYSYFYKMWDSLDELNNTQLDADWREKMKAETTLDYLIDHNKLIVSPGCGYVIPAETVEEMAIRKQCRGVIQKYSWDMVFADDEEEFYSLLKEMQTEAISLGYEKILARDMEVSMGREKARWEAVERYQNNHK